MRRTITVGLALLGAGLLVLPSAAAHIVFCVPFGDSCASFSTPGKHGVVDACGAAICGHTDSTIEAADVQPIDDRFDRLFGPVEADVPL